MTEDLKILLDDASSSGSPPMAFTAEDVVAKGRKRSTRRTVLAGGGLTVLTVLSVAAGLVLNGGGGGPAPLAAGSSSPSSSSNYTPPLPDGDIVGWNSRWLAQDTTGTAISGALAAKLKELYPDVKNVLWGPGDPPNYVNTKTLVDPAGPDSSFRIDRYAAALMTAANTDQLPPGAIPIYRNWSGMPWPGSDMMSEFGSPFDAYQGIQLVLDGQSKDNVEALRVAVFPEGSYVEGFDATGPDDPKGGHLVSGCDEQTIENPHGGADTKVTFACDETTGPNAERILTVVRTTWWGGKPVKDLTTVVYRTDGTAVVVGTSADKPLDWKQGHSFDETPGLSMDDLLALALAVPPVAF